MPYLTLTIGIFVARLVKELVCNSFFVTFFEKKVTPKNFTVGKVFAYIVRSTVERTMFAQTKAVKFSPAFFKRRRSQGRVALVALRRERNTFILPKTQEWVNSFAMQRKRENLVGGSPFFAVFWFFRGGVF